jgi:hypothetical protein
MDQGIAALAGAGIGVVGSLGTAGLAYLAAERQARDRGRIEHAQKLSLAFNVGGLGVP